MAKIINLGTSAFYELQEATKKVKISFDGFENAISKAFPKQAKKEKSIKDKISDLNGSADLRSCRHKNSLVLQILKLR